MGRQIRSTLPISTKSLSPEWPDLQKFRKVDEQFKQKQKKNFDQRYCAIELPTFSDDEPVFITTERGIVPTPGRIVQTNLMRYKHPRELSEGIEVTYILVLRKHIHQKVKK